MTVHGRLTFPGLLAVLLLFPNPASPMDARCDQVSCVTDHDTIPNFAGQPTIRSARSGLWSDPATWTPARVPGSSDVVLIVAGTTVTYNATSGRVKVVGIEGSGRLTFLTDVSTRLTVGTLLVMPAGSLLVGTKTSPVLPRVTAEIVIANDAVDVTDDGLGTFDPRQYGTGLLSVDGQVWMHGAVKTGYVRLAAEPKAGDLVLKLASPVSGWRAGDRLFLPDSKHYAIETVSYVYEGEEMTVSSVSADKLEVTLTNALRFNHPGARDGNGVLEFLPHAGNLTRNVVVRSEVPAGTRGHVLLTSRGDVDVRYTGFRNLGRTTVDPLDSTTFDAEGRVIRIGTNQVGRYPVHIHHLIGPSTTPLNGYQFTLAGNAVDDDATLNRRKWAITVHGSHWGQIHNNVVYNAGGWGIGTEDGTESFNEFTSNFVARVRGEGGAPIPKVVWASGSAGPTTACATMSWPT